MGKGILLELEGRHAVVLTSQGEFRKVPAPPGQCEIGEEIEFSERKPVLWAQWGLMAAAAAAMLLLMPAGYQSWFLAQPASMVTVDINPSIELTLNGRDQVLRARGLNEDGELILHDIDWRRQTMASVVGSITDLAMEQGKLDPTSDSGTVIVSVAPLGAKELSNQVAERVTADARSAVYAEITEAAHAKQGEPKTSVAAVAVSVQEKQEAEEAGLTPGKFRILKEIQEIRPEVQSEQLQVGGPGSLFKELDLNPGTIFGKAEGHKADKKKADAEPNEGRKDEDPILPTAVDELLGAKGGLNGDSRGQGSDRWNGSGLPEKPSDEKNTNGKSDEKNSNGKSDEKKNNNGKSDEKRPKGMGQDGKPEQEKPDKDNRDKRETWKVPLLPIEIPIPAMFRDMGNSKSPAVPRAEEPGDGSPSGKPDQGKPDQGKPDQGKPDQGKPDQGKPDQGKPDQSKPDQGKPDQGKPDQSKPDQGKPDQSKPDQGKPDQGKPDQGKPDQGKPDQGKPDQGKPDQGKPDQGKPDPGKPDQGKRNSGKTEEKMNLPTLETIHSGMLAASGSPSPELSGRR